MYNSANPGLEELKKYFRIKGISDSDVEINNDVLTIKSDEDIYCEVTNVDIGFKVTCKSSDSKIDKQYLSKIIEK